MQGALVLDCALFLRQAGPAIPTYMLFGQGQTGSAYNLPAKPYEALGRSAGRAPSIGTGPELPEPGCSGAYPRVVEVAFLGAKGTHPWMGIHAC